MAFYWSVYVPHDIDRLHPLAAPLRADLTGLPPVMVLLAELDVLRSEGEALVAKLRASGVAVETETFAGVVHGFLRATGAGAEGPGRGGDGGGLDHAGWWGGVATFDQRTRIREPYLRPIRTGHPAASAPMTILITSISLAASEKCEAWRRNFRLQ